MEKTETNEKLIYTKPESLKEVATPYCPGCTHGIASRLIAEVIDEMGIREKIIGVLPVGCAADAYLFFNFDTTGAAHGRAPAMATGLKRVMPNKVIFTYQGDGDLASIGAAEIIHAAGRGEKITAFFVNNAIYGMTGGQLSATTLPGQRTTTTPLGRDIKMHGFPLPMCEALSQFGGAVYIVRRSLHNPANIREAKKAIRTAFEVQVQGLGFAMVELLSSCPTNWGVTPSEALQWIEEHMIPVYPLGDIKVHPAIHEGTGLKGR